MFPLAKYVFVGLAIRSNNGMEFKFYILDVFLGKEGIQHILLAIYFPPHHGVAGRECLTLVEDTKI
jgi:hypothetical protein